MWRIGIVGILLYVISLVEGKASYVVTCSDRLVPGLSLGVRVSILKSSRNVSVNAEIQHASNGSIVATKRAIVSKGMTDLFQIQVPGGLLKSSYNLVVRGSGGLTFHNQSVLLFDDYWPLIYIQTDKTRYSAGQEVKYRAIVLQPSLLGYNGNVFMTISDGKDTNVMMTGPVKPQLGVVSGSLTLSRYPAFGDWHIRVSTGEKSAVKKITVDDYVLPKFSVTVTLPEIHSSMYKPAASVPIDVSARFTFNADVFGKCTIEIYNEDDLRSYITYTKQISGNAHFDVPMTEIDKLGLFEHNHLNVRVLVTDNATMLTIATEEELIYDYIHRPYVNPISIFRVDNTRSTFVPGMLYYTTVFVGHGRLGSPFGRNGSIEVSPTFHTAEVKPCNLNTHYPQWLHEITTKLKPFNADFDESGFASIRFDVPNNTAKVELKLSVKSAAGSASKYIELRAVPRSSTDFLRVAINNPHGEVGETMTLSVETTTELNGTLLFEVKSRGITVVTKQVTLRSNKQTTVPILMTAEMVPLAFVVVTHVTEQGNLISDYVVLHVDGYPFRNNVNATFSTSELQPRQTVSLSINADPHSKVYVFSEDKKNRLLGSENDIYHEKINKDVLFGKIDVNTNVYKFIASGGRQASLHDDYGDTEDSFIETGTVYMSDASVFDMTSFTDLLFTSDLPRKCEQPTTMPPNYMLLQTAARSTAPPPDMLLQTAAMSTAPPPAAKGQPIYCPRPRTDDSSSRSSGLLVINYTVPDSMTSWVTSVFAMNSHTGFGVSSLKPSITVKKDFFLTMDTPSSIVLGEEFLLQLTAYNYMDTLQQVFVDLTTSDESSSHIPAATIVKPGRGHSTFLHITPDKIGTLKIHVIAKAGSLFTVSAVDELERVVVVKPAGVYKETNEQHIVEVSSSGSKFSMLANTADPPHMVRGTKSVRVQFTGNYMGPSIDGLQNLIRMPSGCGEQVMVHFAPNIYITKYLKSVRRLTADLQNKWHTKMTSGLQRELKYQRRDGSFSAWGDHDSSGSSWLTAFVIKCFGQADGLINIDRSILRKAMSWLIQYQKTDGSFLEPGRIIHRDMQAGTSAGLKLTAFILNALLESKDLDGLDNAKIPHVIQKGQQHLESNLHSITDVYTLAIVCYTLAKSGSNQKSTCLTKLEAAKVSDGGHSYWEANAHVARRSTRFLYTTKTRAPARDIEATAYCLLAYIELRQTVKGFHIVRWLVSQRNPNGGFKSTQAHNTDGSDVSITSVYTRTIQKLTLNSFNTGVTFYDYADKDTVISLQALSQFAYGRTPNYNNFGIAFNASGGAFHHFYAITWANKDVVHEAEVSGAKDTLQVDAVGNGIAMVDVTMAYYVSAVTNSNMIISVTSTLTHDTLNSVTVRPCIGWHGAVTSGMLVAEVEMPTGFVSDVDSLKSQSTIRHHETNGRIVALYFDGIRSGRQVCVDVKMDRSDPVVRSQACHITVYDYYEPNWRRKVNTSSTVAAEA